MNSALQNPSIANKQSGKQWFVIFSKPRQETTASLNLERQGYEVYLPMVEQRKRRLGRVVITCEPLFPRYLFIHLDRNSDNWRPIRSTVGVSKLVQFGHEPCSAPDQLIDTIRKRENHEGVVPYSSLRPEFTVGDSVQVVEGAMTGFEGIFLSQTSKERVLVLLEIMGKASRTQISIDSIAPNH